MIGTGAGTIWPFCLIRSSVITSCTSLGPKFVGPHTSRVPLQSKYSGVMNFGPIAIETPPAGCGVVSDQLLDDAPRGILPAAEPSHGSRRPPSASLGHGNRGTARPCGGPSGRVAARLARLSDDRRVRRGLRGAQLERLRRGPHAH